MAARTADQLVLTISAELELLRQKAQEADGILTGVEKASERTAARVNANTAKMGTGFGPFSEQAEAAATNARRAFEDSYRAIQQLADRAVSAQPTEAGGLNVGAAEARAAAEASRQRAAALAQIEAATNRAAAAEGRHSAETLRFIAAISKARQEEEARTAGLMRQAGALERVEAELAQAGAASAVFGQQQQRGVAMTGQQRAGMQQLSFQISDVATQFGMGINPMVIFAQQANQVVYAISAVRGEAGAFTAFLAGPWGAVLLGAVSLLGIMAATHFQAADAKKEHKSTADSLRDAVNALADSMAAANRQTRQGIIDTIEYARSQRQAAFDVRKRLQAELDLAKGRIQSGQNYLQGGGGSKGGVEVAAGQMAAGNSAAATIEARLKSNQEEINRLDRAISVGNARIVMRDAQGRLDPSTAANNRYEDRVDALTRRFEAGKMGNPTSPGAKAYFEQQIFAAGQARDAELKRIQDAQRKGPSAEAAARRAEAVRQRELGEDFSFINEERAARRRLIEASRRGADTEERRTALAREDIEDELAATKAKNANRAAAGKLSAAERAQLDALAEQLATQKRANLDNEDRARAVKDALRIDNLSIDLQLAQLEVEAGMAATAKARRDIELKILMLQTEREKRLRQAILDDPTSSDDDRQRARDDMRVIDAGLPAKAGQIEQQYAGPLEDYRARLTQAAGDIDEALENVEVNALSRLEDGLLSIIDGTESVAGAFKKMAASIIADLIRIAIQRAILSAIGGGGGGFLGLFGGGGKVDGFAGGGRISGPGTGTSDSILALVGGTKPIRVSNGEYIVNAEATRRHLPLIEAINSGRLPGFARGGMPSLRAPRLPSFAGTGSGRWSGGGETIVVEVDKSELFDVHVRRAAAPQTQRAALAGAQLAREQMDTAQRTRLL